MLSFSFSLSGLFLLWDYWSIRGLKLGKKRTEHKHFIFEGDDNRKFFPSNNKKKKITERTAIGKQTGVLIEKLGIWHDGVKNPYSKISVGVTVKLEFHEKNRRIPRVDEGLTKVTLLEIKLDWRKTRTTPRVQHPLIINKSWTYFLNHLSTVSHLLTVVTVVHILRERFVLIYIYI